MIEMENNVCYYSIRKDKAFKAYRSVIQVSYLYIRDIPISK